MLKLSKSKKENRIENILMSKGNRFCCTQNTHISKYQSIFMYRNGYPTKLYYVEGRKIVYFSKVLCLCKTTFVNCIFVCT